MSQCCDECGALIQDEEIFYQVTVSLQADPTPPKIRSEATSAEPGQELKQLIERMAAMTDEEIADAEAQVHEQFILTYCAACRSSLRKLLRNRQGLME